MFEGIATILYRSQSQTLPRYRGNNSASTDREDRLTKRCLFWVLALLQGNKSGNRSSCSCGSQNGDDTHTDNVQGDNPDGSDMRTGGHTSLAYSLSGNTMRDLKKSLEFVSRDKSKKGLLAALLVHYF